MQEMKEKDIMKLARKERNLTQVVLAEKVGMKQNALSAYMLRNRMSVYGFTKILEAMDYDVVVVDRKSGELVWKVIPEE